MNYRVKWLLRYNGEDRTETTELGGGEREGREEAVFDRINGIYRMGLSKKLLYAKCEPHEHRESALIGRRR
jgi:hypothetical protein